MDLGQGEVVVDVESIDGPQIGDPVFVSQQVRLVDGHLILSTAAEDLYLQRQNNKLSQTSPLTTLYGAFMEPVV